MPTSPINFRALNQAYCPQNIQILSNNDTGIKDEKQFQEALTRFCEIKLDPKVGQLNVLPLLSALGSLRELNTYYDSTRDKPNLRDKLDHSLAKNKSAIINVLRSIKNGIDSTTLIQNKPEYLQQLACNGHFALNIFFKETKGLFSNQAYSQLITVSNKDGSNFNHMFLIQKPHPINTEDDDNTVVDNEDTAIEIENNREEEKTNSLAQHGFKPPFSQYPPEQIRQYLELPDNISLPPIKDSVSDISYSPQTATFGLTETSTEELETENGSLQSNITTTTNFNAQQNIMVSTTSGILTITNPYPGIRTAITASFKDMENFTKTSISEIANKVIEANNIQTTPVNTEYIIGGGTTPTITTTYDLTKP